ncbi:endonuclease/exonuclease/phosphatase family protein [Streptomyces griseus]|uniref:endonuclease/exonuclease/phosphatase family protein n=1 Tax=Streptomyces griseus TaxID=1911 RepID=UPI0004C970E5|nr:endonuclease/exonuclease/phosphatase family protein [Streptomyces griseus]
MAPDATGALPASRTEPDGTAVVRILSYNIRSMRDDEDALARVIRACAPDVVLVQEAPRFFRWRKHAARLAAKSELVVLSGGATAAGPLLLCSLRATVERTEDVLLPLTPGLHRRGLATAVVRFGAARLGLISCHLSLREDERYDQAGRILDRVAALDAPYTIVAGDLNERPGGPAFTRLTATLRDGWEARPLGTGPTFPATAPRSRVDAVLATDGVEFLGCGVPTAPSPADLTAATDHLPVLAAVRLRAPA